MIVYTGKYQSVYQNATGDQSVSNTRSHGLPQVQWSPYSTRQMAEGVGGTECRARGSHWGTGNGFFVGVTHYQSLPLPVPRKNLGRGWKE